MQITNFEFKAKVDDLEKYEQLLLTLKPDFRGIDHQTDTYFQVPKGRLKLREGNIENALINYDREDIPGSKESKIILYKHEPNEALKEILVQQFGIKAIVDKKRKIYFLENIKFHFDQVASLGCFVEVEAIDTDGVYSIKELKSQCDHYFQFFGLSPQQILSKSYFDMILENT